MATRIEYRPLNTVDAVKDWFSELNKMGDVVELYLIPDEKIPLVVSGRSRGSKDSVANIRRMIAEATAVCKDLPGGILSLLSR